MATETDTYEIFKFFNETQAEFVARVEAPTYKHGLGNAARIFIRDSEPESGRYLAVGKRNYSTANENGALVFEIKQASAILNSKPVGGDFGWGYAVGGKVLPENTREERCRAEVRALGEQLKA